MISKQKVTELALEKIKELDYFLVDVKISATNEITVLFDKNVFNLLRIIYYFKAGLLLGIEGIFRSIPLTIFFS